MNGEGFRSLQVWLQFGLLKSVIEAVQSGGGGLQNLPAHGPGQPAVGGPA